MKAVHTAMRFPAADLAEIDELADQHGLSRTSFLIDTALGRLPQNRSQLHQRVEQLEHRLDRAERLLDLGTHSS